MPRGAPERDEFLPTRRSLLSRLKNCDDNESWRDFFETYWRLIYDVARKAGFSDAESQDIVQDTVISVSRQIQDLRYDSEKGQFKNWLRLITRRRIADQWRKKYREPEVESATKGSMKAVENVASHPELDSIWEAEWERKLMTLALERVKRQVKPEHFQIFDLCTLQEWPMAQVSKALGVSMSLIYVTRHRIGRLLKKELRVVEREFQ